MYFNSLLTFGYRDHLILSGQFQKDIELLEFFLKNFLRFFNIVIKWSWYKWTEVLKICFVARIASVITIILEMSCSFIAWSILYLTVKTIHSVIDRLVMAFTNMKDQSGNIVLDTYIRNNKYFVLIVERIFIDIIKSIAMSS